MKSLEPQNITSYFRNTGIAILAKTPGISPIKTRLAQSIGKENAEYFHILASHALEEVVLSVTNRIAGLCPYWSVAEEAGISDARWQKLKILCQGEGEFGVRLFSTYNQLIDHHENSIFMVSDSPQISPDLIELAIHLLEMKKSEKGFVLGPSSDGGFYLFGGSQRLEVDFWLGLPYSSPDAGKELLKRLEQVGPVELLPVLSDVDILEDLKLLYVELSSNYNALNLHQQKLLKWIEPFVTSTN